MKRLPIILIVALFFLLRFAFGYSVDLFLVVLLALLIRRKELISDYQLLLVLAIGSLLFSQSITVPVLSTFVVIGIFDIVKPIFHGSEISFYILGFSALILFKFLEFSLWNFTISGKIILPGAGSVLIPVIIGTIGGLILLFLLRRYEQKAIKTNNLH